MIHTREALIEAADLLAPADNGRRTVTMLLAPGDKAWNPDRNDTLLRGPGRVTYVLWDDGDIDHAFSSLVGA